ncbi:MAG: amidase [Alphaproteobacteria bacterium]|nr:amidase [Alphaproteobacteria bacterium]
MGELFGSFVSGFCSHEDVSVPGADGGPLAGTSFAAKDIIDVEGFVTGCGNPDWFRTHDPAPRHAAAIARLLDAGANLSGKTITEELAYGLIGENFHYGTPVNPRADGRVPGGSSSGSASVVACAQVDFALGTDTGGSVRVPAAFCGLYGIRPSHGRVPLDGIMPLAPSLDTCGWFARDAELFHRVGRVLLAWSDCPAPSRLLIAEDAFALASEEVQAALVPAVEAVTDLLGPAKPVRPCDMAGLAGYPDWQRVMQVTRGSEAAASHLAWIRSADPEMGPLFRERFEAGGAYTPADIADAMSKRAMIDGYLSGLLGEDAVLLVPAAPAVAPPARAPEEVYDRLRTANELYNCAAPLARLPQVSLPFAEAPDGPVGLGIIAGHGNDEMLLDLAVSLSDRLPG